MEREEVEEEEEALERVKRIGKWKNRCEDLVIVREKLIDEDEMSETAAAAIKGERNHVSRFLRQIFNDVVVSFTRSVILL